MVLERRSATTSDIMGHNAIINEEGKPLGTIAQTKLGAVAPLGEKPA